MARCFGLNLVLMAVGLYDLVVGRRDYFEPPFQKLLAVMRDDAFPGHTVRLGGYDVSGTGRTVFNG